MHRCWSTVNILNCKNGFVALVPESMWRGYEDVWKFWFLLLYHSFITFIRTHYIYVIKYVSPRLILSFIYPIRLSCFVVIFPHHWWSEWRKWFVVQFLITTNIDWTLIFSLVSFNECVYFICVVSCSLYVAVVASNLYNPNSFNGMNGSSNSPTFHIRHTTYTIHMNSAFPFGTNPNRLGKANVRFLLGNGMVFFFCFMLSPLIYL